MNDSLKQAFRDLSIAILTHTIKSDAEIARRFYDLPISRQGEVEDEIERRAELIAESMCQKLGDREMREPELSSSTIARLYRQALRENESL